MREKCIADRVGSLWLILLISVFLAGGGCALQDDIIIVDKRLASLSQRVSKQESAIELLRSDISRHQEDQMSATQAFREQQADLRALMDDLREDILVLRGRLEEVGYMTHEKMGTVTEEESKREEQIKRLEHAVQASRDRIVRLEDYFGLEPSEKMVSQKTPPAGKKQESPTQKSPDLLYVQAKEKFDRAEYDTARELFQSFLKEHPKSDNADNAQFWLGEIYYREKWYEKAILEYQKVLERYPKGNKVRGALLKQGFAFLSLGDKDNARLILKELVRKYPDSSEAKIAKDKLSTLE
jgi:tol-pal system protein YbgF